MTAKLELRVANLDCESDGRALERGLKPVPGVVGVTVSPKAAKVVLSYEPTVTSPDALEAKLHELGFTPQKGASPTGPPRPWRNPKVLTSVGSGTLLLAGWLLSLAGIPRPLVVGLYLASLLAGAWYFGREALQDLVFERHVGIELLMLVAAVVATLMGEVAEGAMLAFLYSISEAAEGYTEEKTRSAIRALMELAPKVATVRRDGREIEVPVEQVKVGDVFIVRPGQGVATDGVVVGGRSSVDQAPVTGESVPVEKDVGQPVFAGTINGEGALEVRATKTSADNTIARIIAMVEEAQEKKGQSQRTIERFGARYSPAVLLAGIAVAVVPPLGLGAPWALWLTRATVFIVAAAPCALVISIPITLVAALGTAARHGVLIKGGVFIEELARVRVVALDKTGTITAGRPEVTDVILLSGDALGRPAAEQEVVALAAGIEHWSQHPLARAIVRHAEAKGIAPAAATGFQSLTGAGATATVGGRTIHVGSHSLFEQKLGIDLAAARADIDRLQAEGKTVVVVGDAGGAWALLAVRDNVRPNAAAAVRALHAVGVAKVVMLSGDNARTAAAIAREVGIDEVHADLTPEDKVTRVKALAAKHGHVAMVGDGVNDAPALAAATVGIAMGAAGTDVALETADVALMADDLEKLAYAFQLARRNRAVVRQNLALSTAVIAVLVVGAVAGMLSLPMAVIGHEVSEFVVIGSGLRLLRG